MILRSICDSSIACWNGSNCSLAWNGTCISALNYRSMSVKSYWSTPHSLEWSSVWVNSSNWSTDS